MLAWSTASRGYRVCPSEYHYGLDSFHREQPCWKMAESSADKKIPFLPSMEKRCFKVCFISFVHIPNKSSMPSGHACWGLFLFLYIQAQHKPLAFRAAETITPLCVFPCLASFFLPPALWAWASSWNPSYQNCPKDQGSHTCGFAESND